MRITNDVIIGVKQDVGICGTASLSAGTVTINTTKVQANSIILLTCQGGDVTRLSTYYISDIDPGVGFKINSKDGGDGSTVGWYIIQP